MHRTSGENVQSLTYNPGKNYGKKQKIQLEIIFHHFNAGISLTGYHPPGTPGLLHRNVCPAPGLLHNRKCSGAGPINGDVPGTGHLHQHKEC